MDIITTCRNYIRPHGDTGSDSTEDTTAGDTSSVETAPAGTKYEAILEWDPLRRDYGFEPFMFQGWLRGETDYQGPFGMINLRTKVYIAFDKPPFAFDNDGKVHEICPFLNTRSDREKAMDVSVGHELDKLQFRKWVLKTREKAIYDTDEALASYEVWKHEHDECPKR